MIYVAVVFGADATRQCLPSGGSFRVDSLVRESRVRGRPGLSVGRRTSPRFGSEGTLAG